MVKSKPHILVSGGAGYIGSMTAKLLQASGFRVTVFDNLSTGHKKLAKFGEFVEGDLLDVMTANALFEKDRIDGVVHFAAKSQVGESVQKPIWYYQNNIIGTFNLLEAAKRHNIGAFVFSSTAAVYGEPQEIPISEKHPLAPISPYGHSKLAIEWMLHDTSAAHGLPYIALRYFNAAGADPDGDCGEWHEPETHLIPNLLRAAAVKGRFSLFGDDYDTPDGTCIRDYVHVYDLAEAHRLALIYLLDGNPSAVMNLGCAQGTSVREMLEIAESVSGYRIAYNIVARRAGDPAKLIASRERASRILGWAPKYDDPRDMVKHAWDWYQANGFGADE